MKGSTKNLRKEIKFLGRGGQGIVTAAEVLARAAIFDGKYAHSFPFFGAERRGAPVLAFTRIDDLPIRTREQIYEPDYVVVLDPTVYRYVDVTTGLKRGGEILINTRESPHDIRRNLKIKAKVFVVDATRIAMEVLKRPITNMVVLGGLARASGLISFESLSKAIACHFDKSVADVNIKAAGMAYEKVLGE